jgi:2-dehydro-3-deoxygluconokinase
VLGTTVSVEAMDLPRGFFYGVLTDELPEQAMKAGLTHGALLTTFPGDTTMATLEEVRVFAKGGTARIQR